MFTQFAELLLSFWTLSIVRISTNGNHTVSATGSVSVFRRGGGAPTLQKKQKLAFPQAMPEQKFAECIDRDFK
jgi:hypothetical protein